MILYMSDMLHDSDDDVDEEDLFFLSSLLVHLFTRLRMIFL